MAKSILQQIADWRNLIEAEYAKGIVPSSHRLCVLSSHAENLRRQDDRRWFHRWRKPSRAVQEMEALIRRCEQMREGRPT